MITSIVVIIITLKYKVYGKLFPPEKGITTFLDNIKQLCYENNLNVFFVQNGRWIDYSCDSKRVKLLMCKKSKSIIDTHIPEDQKGCPKVIVILYSSYYRDNKLTIIDLDLACSKSKYTNHP